MKMVQYRNLLSAILLFPSVVSWTSSPQTRIQVCQNKDCCRQWTLTTPLPETLQDLLPPNTDSSVEVATSGCLSLCGKGPNLYVKTKEQGRYLQGITNPAMLAVQLEEITGKVPAKLLAAVTVMEKAQKASSADEKERFLNSVIQTLSADSELESSSANARAHVLRAEMYYNEKRYQDALRDIKAAIALSGATDSLKAKAWRIAADTHLATGQLDDAVQALQQVAVCNPYFRSKIAKEIQQLCQAAAS